MRRKSTQSGRQGSGAVIFINTNDMEHGTALCRYLQSKDAARAVETLVIAARADDDDDPYPIPGCEEDNEAAAAEAAASAGGSGSPSSSRRVIAAGSPDAHVRLGAESAGGSPGRLSSPTAASSSSSSSSGSGGGAGGILEALGAMGGMSGGSTTPVTVKQLYKIAYSFVAKATKLRTLVFDGQDQLTSDEVTALSKALAQSKANLTWLGFVRCPLLADNGVKALTAPLTALPVQVLVLEGCGLTDKACKYLSVVIKVRVRACVGE